MAYQNTSELALAFLLAVIPSARDWSGRLLQSGISGAAPLYLAMVVAGALTLTGLAATWKRSRPTIHLYAVAYIGLVLIWPHRPERFLVPILPLLLTWLMAGVYVVIVFGVGSVLRLVGGKPACSGASEHSGWFTLGTNGVSGSATAGRLVILLALALGYASARPIVQQPGRQRQEDWLRQREALVNLLEASTPPNAVICSPFTGYFYLRTGRKFVPFVPYENPSTQLYPADRKFSGCGRLITRTEMAETLRGMEARLLDHLHMIGATFIIPAAKNALDGLAFEEFRRTHPRAFRLVRAVEPFSLYRVLPRRR